MGKIRFLISILLLLACPLPVLAGRPLLVPNGGFESGSTDGWKVLNPSQLPLDWKVTDEPGEVRAGRWAGCLSSFGQTTGTLEICNSVDVNGLAPGTLLRFRYSDQNRKPAHLLSRRVAQEQFHAGSLYA